ncbi:MAG: glutamate 5-kinase [Spirochaetota bacterium]
MRILIKIGSALISDGPRIRLPWLAQKIWEIAELIRERSHGVLIVSSGAVAAGMEMQGLTERPRDVLELQQLSGIGQVRLMTHYKEFFREWNIAVAQILLTHHNFSSDRERNTITQIVDAYLSKGVVPIVNENDMVDKEEFDYQRRFSDNDILAALVGVNVGVDLAVLLTDVDGLYAADPKKDSSVALIERVERVTPEIEAMASREGGALGLGGMSSKVIAARRLTEAGIPTIIASGRHSIPDIVAEKAPSTRFRAQPVAG